MLVLKIPLVNWARALKIVLKFQCCWKGCDMNLKTELCLCILGLLCNLSLCLEIIKISSFSWRDALYPCCSTSVLALGSSVDFVLWYLTPCSCKRELLWKWLVQSEGKITGWRHQTWLCLSNKPGDTLQNKAWAETEKGCTMEAVISPEQRVSWRLLCEAAEEPDSHNSVLVGSWSLILTKPY